MKKIRNMVIIGSFFVVILLGLLIYVNRNIEVKLVGASHIVLNYNENYEEQGAKVFFNERELNAIPEIHSNVDVSKVGDYTVEYEYQLLNIHKTIVRKVSVVDAEPPILSLIGELSIKLQEGEAYEEPGFEASDNVDGDLISQVKVEMPEDISQVGSYEIIYSVVDSSGNVTKLSRTLEITKKVVVNPDTPTKPKDAGVIYLTFDDGPHEATTARILNILKEEGVKATFFVVGVGPDALIKRAYDEGHTIGLHTYTHVYKDLYASVESYYADLKSISDRVERITGEKSMILRFPGGTSNLISRSYSKGIMSFLATDVLSKGYSYHDWNVSGEDATQGSTAASIYKNTIKDLSKGRSNNVLLHDNKPQTADALRDIIRYAKANGYRFEPITSDSTPVRHRPAN